MEQETIVVKIRDCDPLYVAAHRLTADSKKFRYLINELHFTELEMDDFDPDTVALFLRTLEDKQVGDIEERHFRELHKMSVVFEVEWLTERCREWLEKKIKSMDSGAVYDTKLFLFEESRYILDTWEVATFMELVIVKMDTMDNTAFISQYMSRDFDKLKTKQLDLLLKLGGSKTEHKVFLEIVLQNLANKQFLDENMKHLLRGSDLSLCLEQNRDLYDQLFETLPAMSELTNSDWKFILKLSVESARKAYSRKCMVLEEYEKKKMDDEKKDNKTPTCELYDQEDDYEEPNNYANILGREDYYDLERPLHRQQFCYQEVDYEEPNIYADFFDHEYEGLFHSGANFYDEELGGFF